MRDETGTLQNGYDEDILFNISCSASIVAFMGCGGKETFGLKLSLKSLKNKKGFWSGFANAHYEQMVRS